MHAKTISKIVAGLALFAFALSARAERQIIPLATDWKFIRQDVDPAASTADWRAVTVPHTWNDREGGASGARTPADVKTPAGAAAAAKAAPKKRPVITTDDPHLKDGYYRGVGWYARTIEVPADWKNRQRVFLRFEAVSQVAKIYLNGQFIGEHRGAFTAFCLELTTNLNYGAANELRVRADNSLRSDVPPLKGDFDVCGGIYRPAALIVADRVCVSPLDRASPGVYVTTKNLTDEKAEVEVRAVIANGADAAREVPVEFQIRDAGGQVVAAGKAGERVEAGATASVAAVLPVQNPHRWNGRLDPYLYAVTVKVPGDGGDFDSVTQPLGLRTVAITEADGFLLNGKPYPIRGVSRHQERQGRGWALSSADHDEDMRLIFDLGATAVRNTHYPQAGYWHDLADRNGVLMWDEVSLVDAVTLSPEFGANAETQLRELIAQLYNHPSVAFFGLFNELGYKFNHQADPLLAHLKAVVRELDAARLIVGAGYGTQYCSFERIPDHAGFNRYPLWYSGADSNAVSAILEQDAADRNFLGHRSALPEYGAGANPAQHQEGKLLRVVPLGRFHPEEWQTHVHEVAWSAIRGDTNLWGAFVWTMFDFPSGWRREGDTVGLNDKGLVTHDHKLCKDAYYFYKANWNPAPMVYIASRRMTPRRLAETEVRVFCNAGKVELTVNGQSRGIVEPDSEKIACWKSVTLNPGKNLIRAVAVDSSGRIADECEWELLAEK
jgi:beta-galactosidase